MCKCAAASSHRVPTSSTRYTRVSVSLPRTWGVVNGRSSRLFNSWKASGREFWRAARGSVACWHVKGPLPLPARVEGVAYPYFILPFSDCTSDNESDFLQESSCFLFFFRSGEQLFVWRGRYCQLISVVCSNASLDISFYFISFFFFFSPTPVSLPLALCSDNGECMKIRYLFLFGPLPNVMGNAQSEWKRALCRFVWAGVAKHAFKPCPYWKPCWTGAYKPIRIQMLCIVLISFPYNSWDNIHTNVVCL